MKKSSISSLRFVGCIAVVGTLAAFAPIPSHGTNNATPVAADNTATNAPSQNGTGQYNEQVTADQAGQDSNDRAIMQRIRQAIVADNSLSTYAKNVKVIAQNGKVTLKGPVQNQQESQNIEAKAEQVAGNGNVMNDLSVQ